MKNWFLFLCLLLAFGSVSHAFETGGDEENPFKVWYESEPSTFNEKNEATFTVLIEIPEHYYLYVEKTNIEVESFSPELKIGEVKKPMGEEKADPFFGKKVPVYFNQVELSLPIRLEKPTDLTRLAGKILFQGCSTQLCYKPIKIPFDVQFKAKSASAGSSSNKPLPLQQNEPQPEGFLDSVKSALQNPFSGLFASRSLWFGILISFLGGIFTAFTPCVWPLIPITLSIIGIRQTRSVGQNLKTVSILVLGMAVMYSLLGVSAAIFGKSLGFLFQSRVFVGILVVFLFVFALGLLDVFEFQIPLKLRNRLVQIQGKGSWGIFWIGLTLGLLAAPCVGPVVGALLVYVAQTGSIRIGFINLLVYALGMGLLFVVLGVFYGTFKPHSGPWLDKIKKILGILLLLVAFDYAQSLFQSPKQPAFWGSLQQTSSGKPTVIDFFAEWCPPCKEWDRTVFSDPRVQEKLKSTWSAVKIDCTTETKDCTDHVEQYSVVGWPTIIFLDANGNVIHRLVGEVLTPEDFLELLTRLENN